MHIVHFISSLGIGGAERVLSTLIEHLHHAGHQQTVLYIHDGPVRDEIEALGIATLKAKNYLFRYDPLFIFFYLRQLWHLKPDLIHASLWAANFIGVFASRLLRIPIVCALHAQRQVEGKLRNRLDRFALPFAHHITCITSTIKAQLLENKSIIRARVTIIENGINPERMTSQAQKSTIRRANIGIGDDNFIIGAVGRFSAEKDFPFLLRAVTPFLREHQNARLLIVGVGPQLNELIELVRQLKSEKQVIFINGKKALDYYHLFDCFILPSTCEALSLSLMEAMSLKIPTIVRGAHYHQMLTHEYHALIVSDASQLQQALYDYMTKPKLVASVIVNSYHFIMTHYHEMSMVESYKTVFKTIVAQNR